MLGTNGNDHLFQLCYISRAARLMATRELSNLLAAARQYNVAHGITGMLLYKDLSFLQILEGPRDALVTLYNLIRVDQRHTRVRTLFDNPIDAREFADWTMGFQNLDGVDLMAIEGYSDLMQADGNAQQLFDNPTRAKRLLLLFRAQS